MKVSASGRARIRVREGERLVAYMDSVGVWTIGVGHTGRMSPGKVFKGMVITKAQSDAFLEADLVPVENALNSVLKVRATQNQFDALASFLFNVGVGWAGVNGHAVASIFTELNAGRVVTAAKAFDNFHRPPEIVGRRNGEKLQFQTPDNPDNPRNEDMAATVTVTNTEKKKVDVFAGIGNIASLVVESLKSSVAAAQSSTTAEVGDGGLVFGTISDAQKAISEINEIIADIKAGKVLDLVDDAIDLLKVIFAILDRYKINVPVVSQIVRVLPDLNPVS